MAPTAEQARLSKTKRLASGKQPKARVHRYLKSVEPQLVETHARQLLLLRGLRCSDAMKTILRDLRSIKAPHAKLLLKNNDIHAFDGDEGTSTLEFLCTKNDCSAFCLASTNKKRPNNLIWGRTYERRVLDMVEVGVTYYKSLLDYGAAPKKRIESKPVLHFGGDRWHLDPTLRRLQNLLVDVYRGEPVSKIVLKGLDHVISFSVSGNNGTTPTIHMRTYFCQLKRHPSKDHPVPYLSPCGPDMDFVLRRTELAPPDVWRKAVKQPKVARQGAAGAKSSKNKNHTTNVFGETVGRLHLEKQDVDHMSGKKSKALKLAHKMEKNKSEQQLESELQREKTEDGQQFEQTFGFSEVN